MCVCVVELSNAVEWSHSRLNHSILGGPGLEATISDFVANAAPFLVTRTKIVEVKEEYVVFFRVC